MGAERGEDMWMAWWGRMPEREGGGAGRGNWEG